jgi:hypothetical protein
VPYAIVCYLDDSSDQAIRELWAMLDAAGIPSLGSATYASYEPHVSLAVFEEADVDTLCDLARSELRAFVGLPLSFTHLGFFLTEEAPAFLAVLMTELLQARHRELWDVLRGVVTGARDYYLPNALVAHCTLAVAVAERGRVANAIPNAALPLTARVESVNIVDVLTGRALRTVSA